MNAGPPRGEQRYEYLRKPVFLPAGLGALLLVLSAADSGAEPPMCGLVTVEASPALDPEWRENVDLLRATLAHDIKGADCIAVELRLEPSASGAIVRARSADGRETVRPLADPRAVVPVVLGLLASAPVESPQTAGSGSRTAIPSLDNASPARDEKDPHEVPDFPPSPPSASVSPPSVHVAIGLSTGLRVGVPTDVIMWDSEVRVDVLFHEWLVFALMRYAPLGAVSGIAADTDEYEELGVGFGAGRRWSWGGHTLDLTASPSAVFVNQEVDSPVEVSGELAQLRIAGAARYGYALGAGWRFTTTLDTEFDVASMIKERRAAPGLPAIPMWTAGLRLGGSASLL